MREKYQSLSLAILRDLAKARGLKGISTLKKDQLIDRMLQEDEKENTSNSGIENNANDENNSVEKSDLIRKTETIEPIQEQPEQPKAEETETTVTSYTAENRGYQENQQRRQNQSRVFNGRTVNNMQDNRRRTTNSYNGGYTNTRNYQDRNQDRNYQDRNQDRNYQDRSQDRSYQDRNQDRNNQDRNYQDRRPQNRYSTDAASGSYNTQTPAAYETMQTPVSRPAPTPKPTPVYDPQVEEQIREANAQLNAVKEEMSSIDSGNEVEGILEVLTDGYGFIRSANYMPGESDVYVSPSQIRRFNLKTGDIVKGNTRVKTEKEKFSALLYVASVNGYSPIEAQRRPSFDELTPIFPNERILMERPGGSVAMRIVDLISPIGKGQRGMIVSQPKAGKTTLLKEIAKSVTYNNPEMRLIILLIDERPEEVTDIKEAIEGENVEVIYSTFDELPEHHKRVSEMVIDRAKRLVEHKQDVMILLDSITRLARAYNLTVPASGRTLSGGLDPAALHMPKRFFGAARNMREGGSLTILATALVDTGSKMDDVVFEEFKGTGNMELVLDRKLSERRIFPAIDIVKSGTRREDLLFTAEEQAAVDIMRRALNGMKSDEAVETALNLFTHSRNNYEVVNQVRKNHIF